MQKDIKSVTSWFMQLFVDSTSAKKPILTIGGHAFDVRFFNKPGDYSQEDREKYPILSIQDYNPLFSGLSDNDVFQYRVVGDEIVFIDVNGADEAHKGIFFRPFLMDFPFDVSLAHKSKDEQDASRLYFLQKFGKRGIINVDGYEDYKIIEDGAAPTIREALRYTVERAEVSRSDGILEDNYSFTVEAWVSSGDPEMVQIIAQSLKNLDQINS